ncbi:hypothetical protein NL676_029785 [Syzygium grande]|nr:hypothetical protein NL676_029785 [Syzygium grande]
MTLSWLSLIILFVSSAAPVCAQKFDFPSLSLHREKALQDPKRRVLVPLTNDFETFFFNQTLDHFNYRPESYTTFKQRYLINRKYWGGANSSAPIFIYFGAEEPIENDLEAIGFLPENAAQFKALLVFIEHRYYGTSIPFGMSLEEALKDPNARGYFTSSQALADYAAIIRDMKEELKAKDCPVIVVGGSYGGMLASWFRLKYPHLAFGALASSAPILYFDGITPQDGYFSVVTEDFMEASKTCYQTISNSWVEIDRVASQPGGLLRLSKIFKTCRPLESGDELKSYLISQYARAAQYDDPPTYPVEVICKGIDGGNTSETGILEKIFAGVVAWHGNSRCYINPPTGTAPSQTKLGWGWQDIERVLRKFGSNIIFSNGLRDPYSSGGRRASSAAAAAPPPPPPIHRTDADEDDENVKQLRECSSLYLSLQDCLVNHDRNWKSCQKKCKLSRRAMRRGAAEEGNEDSSEVGH